MAPHGPARTAVPTPFRRTAAANSGDDSSSDEEYGHGVNEASVGGVDSAASEQDDGMEGQEEEEEEEDQDQDHEGEKDKEQEKERETAMSEGDESPAPRITSDPKPKDKGADATQSKINKSAPPEKAPSKKVDVKKPARASEVESNTKWYVHSDAMRDLSTAPKDLAKQHLGQPCELSTATKELAKQYLYPTAEGWDKPCGDFTGFHPLESGAFVKTVHLQRIPMTIDPLSSQPVPVLTGSWNYKGQPCVVVIAHMGQAPSACGKAHASELSSCVAARLLSALKMNEVLKTYDLDPKLGTLALACTRWFQSVSFDPTETRKAFDGVWKQLGDKPPPVVVVLLPKPKNNNHSTERVFAQLRRAPGASDAVAQEDMRIWSGHAQLFTTRDPSLQIHLALLEEHCAITCMDPPEGSKKGGKASCPQTFYSSLETFAMAFTEEQTLGDMVMGGLIAAVGGPLAHSKPEAAASSSTKSSGTTQKGDDKRRRPKAPKVLSESDADDDEEEEGDGAFADDKDGPGEEEEDESEGYESEDSYDKEFINDDAEEESGENYEESGDEETGVPCKKRSKKGSILEDSDDDQSYDEKDEEDSDEDDDDESEEESQSGATRKRRSRLHRDKRARRVYVHKEPSPIAFDVAAVKTCAGASKKALESLSRASDDGLIPFDRMYTGPDEPDAASCERAASVMGSTIYKGAHAAAAINDCIGSEEPVVNPDQAVTLMTNMSSLVMQLSAALEQSIHACGVLRRDATKEIDPRAIETANSLSSAHAKLAIKTTERLGEVMIMVNDTKRQLADRFAEESASVQRMLTLVESVDLANVDFYELTRTRTTLRGAGVVSSSPMAGIE